MFAKITRQVNRDSLQTANVLVVDPYNARVDLLTKNNARITASFVGNLNDLLAGDLVLAGRVAGNWIILNKLSQVLNQTTEILVI